MSGSTSGGSAARQGGWCPLWAQEGVPWVAGPPLAFRPKFVWPNLLPVWRTVTSVWDMDNTLARSIRIEDFQGDALKVERLDNPTGRFIATITTDIRTLDTRMWDGARDYATVGLDRDAVRDLRDYLTAILGDTK